MSAHGLEILGDKGPEAHSEQPVPTQEQLSALQQKSMNSTLNTLWGASSNTTNAVDMGSQLLRIYNFARGNISTPSIRVERQTTSQGALNGQPADSRREIIVNVNNAPALTFHSTNNGPWTRVEVTQNAQSIFNDIPNVIRNGINYFRPSASLQNSSGPIAPSTGPNSVNPSPNLTVPPGGLTPPSGSSPFNRPDRPI